jgi:hypothetical protein
MKSEPIVRRALDSLGFPTCSSDLFRAISTESSVRVIGMEDLIQIKQHIGRAKDRESVHQLLAIRRLRDEEKSAE